MIQNLDLTPYFKDRVLVDDKGLDFNDSGFFGKKVHIANLKIDSFKTSEKVEVTAREEKGIKYIRVYTSGFKVELTTDFKVKIALIIADSAKNSKIRATIDHIDGEFFFKDGKVHFSKFDVKIGDLKIDFQSIFFDILYKIFGGLVRSGINSAIKDAKSALEIAVNEFTEKEFTIEIGGGIGVNATNTERPQIELLNNNSVQAVFEQTHKFLSNNYLQTTNDNGALITFGIKGALYLTEDPQHKYDFDEPQKMDFESAQFKKDFTLLLNDYTLDTLFYFAHQTGQLRYVMRNDTTNMFPFPLDTQGISQIIPEFGKKYAEAKNLEFKIVSDAIDHKQPIITTSNLGSNIDVNFNIDINTFVSEDPFDDPVLDLSLAFKAVLRVQIYMLKGKLNIFIDDVKLVEMNPIANELGDINFESLKDTLDSLLDIAAQQASQKFMNIDIEKKLEDLTHLNIAEIVVDPNPNHIALSFNVLNN